MNWTQTERLFISLRLENYRKPWTWEYSQAYEYLLEKMVYEHISMDLDVDSSVGRFVELNHQIVRLANESVA